MNRVGLMPGMPHLLRKPALCRCPVRSCSPAAALALLMLVAPVPSGAGGAGAVEWFAPWLRLDESDQRRIRSGRVLSEILPAEGNQVGIFLAGMVDADASTFVRKVRDSEALWKSEQVPQVTRFSTPPRAEDVAALQLEPGDVDAIRACRPGDCDVKLSAAEMRRLQRAAAAAGAAWREAVQDGFRRIVLDRVRAYRSAGLRGLEPFHDHDDPVDPLTVFSRLLLEFPWLSERARRLGGHLERYPAGPAPDSFESFIYWIKTTHTPKPTHQVTHVVMHRPAGAGSGPAVLVASRQLFATHYVNASVALSVFFSGAGDPPRGVLAYVNRSHVDGIGGWLSGVRRYFIERRIRGAAEEAFEMQRRRIAG